jgi:hypothetical protein
MKAIKRPDGNIRLVIGDVSRVVEDGDVVIDLPQDWTMPNKKYRDCWRESNGDIKVNLPLARAKKLEEIRKERDAKLVESDKEWMIAMSTGQAQEAIDAINAKKQALRDLPEAAEDVLSGKLSVNTIDAYEPEWP